MIFQSCFNKFNDVVIMKRKNILFIVLLLFIFVSISAVSANDSSNETIGISEENTISSTVHTVTSSNYNSYFNSGGDLISSSVNEGDTISLDGSFSNKNFTITKKLNVVGTSTNSIKNGVVKLTGAASGSTVSNLNIANTKNYLSGIFVDRATNCVVSNNIINNTGVSSYTICLNGASYCNITYNRLNTYGQAYNHGSRSTSVIVLGSANYNHIVGNDITCEDSNAIYLSEYGGGSFIGGLSYFNTISNNMIKYNVIPTSWAYGIQMMGSNNTASDNKVIGAYRGISTTGTGNIIINNNLINLTGLDYSTGGYSGGDWGIAASSNSYVRGNNFTNCSLAGGAISVGSNSFVEYNNIQNTYNGYGVQAEGNDVLIKNNKIVTNKGAGVYQAGKLEGLVVQNNNIVSNTGVGVLVKKTSSKRFPSNITIINNNIETANMYAIDVGDADKNSYLIAGNVASGTSKILTPEGVIDPDKPVYVFNGTNYNVTPQNYSTFFDENGNMASFIKDGDILTFIGNFSSKDLKITYGVKITAVNTTFENSKFEVTAENVWIENLTIINSNASKLNAWGIFIYQTGKVRIQNNNIGVVDPKAAYAIYVCESKNIEVLNNTLFSSGDYLTNTLLSVGSDDCVFVGNNITTLGTGEVYSYTDSVCLDGEVCLDSEVCLDGQSCLDGKGHIYPELYRTYGILLVYTSNTNVSSNKVSVTSKLNKTYPSRGNSSTNSLVGIDAYFDSDANIFESNTVNVWGNDNYIYGMGVLGSRTGSGSSVGAEENIFISNNINLSGTYFATGIIIGDGSTSTVVESNNINATAQSISYGVTLELSDESYVIANDIQLTSEVVNGIEAYNSHSNVISENNIEGIGNQVYGILFSNAMDNEITYNTIQSKGNGNKITSSNRMGNAGIYLSQNTTGNVISYNNITSALGYAVELDEIAHANEITFNYLDSKNGSGNAGVSKLKDNTVHDNYKYLFNPTFNDISAFYLDKAIFIIADSPSAQGAIVEFFIDNVPIGNASIASNGKASLSYKLNSTYLPSIYNIKAILTKDNYKTTSVSSKLTVFKGNVIVDVMDVSSASGVNAYFCATVCDINGNPIKGLTVNFYRQNNYIGCAISDENGLASTIILIPKGLTGTYNILAKVDESVNFNAANGTGKLTISNRIATKIKASDITMYCKDGTRFEAVLTDLGDNPIANVSVTITINGIDYQRVTDATGKVSMALNLNPCEVNVTTKFYGKGGYVPSETTSSLTILSTIDGNDVVKMYRNGTQYYVKLIGKDGKPLVNVNAEMNINGVLYYRQTNESGVAKLSINLDPDTYILTVTNPSTGEMKSNTVVVNSLFEEANNLTKYDKNASPYTVKVIKKDGKVAGAGVKVKFNINGVIYERETNESGIARLNINLDPGDYIITAEYDGCMVSNSIKVLPILYANDLVKKYGVPAAFKVKLLNEVGKPYLNQNVKFNINGVIYDRSTGDLGTASLNINLDPGVYIITSMYGKSSISNNVTVTN